MTLSDFIASESPILLDGAMGIQLAIAGLEMGGQNCVSHPDAVLSVHKQYSEVGCDILVTNTLTMNGVFIETHGISVDVKEVNLSGAQVAKSAATDEQYVLGDISSTGHMLEPYGNYSEKQFYDTFREQAEHLLSGAVDGFIIETMLDIREALCALRACRDVSPLPVLVTLSFQTTDKGGRTLMGNSAEEVAVALAQAGAAAIGANRGNLDPHETALIVGMMRECVDLPLIAQPNAGKPRLTDGKTTFDMSPEAFCRRHCRVHRGGCEPRRRLLWHNARAYPPRCRITHTEKEDGPATGSDATLVRPRTASPGWSVRNHWLLVLCKAWPPFAGPRRAAATWALQQGLLAGE